MVRNWIAGAALAVLAAAFGGSATAQKIDKLVVQTGSPVPATAYLDIYVAQHAGLFKQEGLEVDFRYSQGAPQAVQIVASNGADVGTVAYEPYLLGHKSGMRGKFIFEEFHYTIFFMAVPEDSPIKTVADLKGKRIGVTNMGSGSLIIARSMLRGAGIDPAPSMFLPVGVGDTAVQALRSGDIQALSLYDGAYAALERAGVKLRYIHHPEIGFIGNAGFLVSEKTYKEKEEQLVRFLRAAIKARIFIKANPEAALKLYWAANPAAKQGGTEAEAIEKGLVEVKFMSPSLLDKPVDQIGRFDMDQVATYLKVMKEEGILTTDIGPRDLATNALLDKVGKIDPEPIRELARTWK
jgi:NitT/TauT family transport system substrate-binding protein